MPFYLSLNALKKPFSSILTFTTFLIDLPWICPTFLSSCHASSCLLSAYSGRRSLYRSQPPSIHEAAAGHSEALECQPGNGSPSQRRIRPNRHWFQCYRKCFCIPQNWSQVRVIFHLPILVSVLNLLRSIRVLFLVIFTLYPKTSAPSLSNVLLKTLLRRFSRYSCHRFARSCIGCYGACRRDRMPGGQLEVKCRWFLSMLGEGLGLPVSFFENRCCKPAVAVLQIVVSGISLIYICRITRSLYLIDGCIHKYHGFFLYLFYCSIPSVSILCAVFLLSYMRSIKLPRATCM